MADVDVAARHDVHYILIVRDATTRPRRLKFTDQVKAEAAMQRAWTAGFAVEFREVRAW